MATLRVKRHGLSRRWRAGLPRTASVRLGLSVLLVVGTLLTLPVDRQTALAAGAAPASLAVHQASQFGLSSALQRLLVEHVYLTGFLVKTILDGQQDQLQASIDAVDANTGVLSDVLADALGPDIREPFRNAWRAQNGLYIDYAFGAVSHDDAKKGAALASLNDARGNIDAALTAPNVGIQPGSVAERLRPHVQGIIGAVDAYAAGDVAGAYASLRAAADGAQAIVDPIVGAVALQPQAPPANGAAGPEMGASAPAQSAGSVSPASSSAPTTSAPPAARACTVAGPAAQYAPTRADFGDGGASFLKQEDAGYFGGNGYLISFERGDGDAFRSSPWGGYMLAGVVIAQNEREAAEDLQNAVRGWTSDWTPYEVASVPNLGDEARVVVRLTPWEIAASQPMAEVFLAVRQCNAVAHVLLAVMPEFHPVTQAVRYGRLMTDRMRP